MNHFARSLADAAPPGQSAAPHIGASATEQPAAPPSRYVRHAILDARAGLPVGLFVAPSTQSDALGKALVVLPAETATSHGLAAFFAAITGLPALVLTPARAAALLECTAISAGPVALGLSPAWLTLERLRALADPTQAQPESLDGITIAEPPGLAATAIHLAKIARLLPAMLVGLAAPVPDLLAVRADHVLAYQAEEIASLTRVAEAVVPLAEAEDARLVAYRPIDGGVEHVALLIGRPEEAAAPLVRVHSECFTGDLLGSLRCDCGPQLHQAIRRMAAEGAGVLLYMAQEGRGIGLVNKLRAYALQDRGLDTLDANRALGWGADERDFGAAALMLRDLGILRVRLLTNNPDKVAALDAAGIEVAGRLRHAIAANGVNDAYLETKARRFGHLLG